MAGDTKLSDLSSATPAVGDLLYICDISDTTDSAAGSSRKCTIQNVLDALALPYGLTEFNATVNAYCYMIIII